MADTNVIPMTNADRDRAALAADAAAGNATMERLVQEFNDLPQARLDRNKAALARTDDRTPPREREVLQNRITQAETEIATAAAAAVLTDQQRVDAVLEGKVAPWSGGSTTGDQIRLGDLAVAVEDMRALGFDAATITAAANGTPQSPRDIGDAEWLFNALMDDKVWVEKLMGGNREANKQLLLLNLIRTAQPIGGK